MDKASIHAGRRDVLFNTTLGDVIDSCQISDPNRNWLGCRTKSILCMAVIVTWKYHIITKSLKICKTVKPSLFLQTIMIFFLDTTTRVYEVSPGENHTTTKIFICQFHIFNFITFNILPLLISAPLVLPKPLRQIRRFCFYCVNRSRICFISELS